MNEVKMDFQSYQEKALQTDRVPTRADSSNVPIIVPMLGLAGEAGQLLSEYKKHLRDGEAHRPQRGGGKRIRHQVDRQPSEGLTGRRTRSLRTLHKPALLQTRAVI